MFLSSLDHKHILMACWSKKGEREREGIILIFRRRRIKKKKPEHAKKK